jgi:hypothetical protein
MNYFAPAMLALSVVMLLVSIRLLRRARRILTDTLALIEKWKRAHAPPGNGVL